MGKDLLVAATDGLIVDGEARTAQLWQDAIGELTESGRDILNLLLALLWILIHREHAQDDVLVLDIAGLHQFLESLPVLSRVLGIDGSIHLDLLQLFVHVLLRYLLTLVGQLVVDVEATVRRCEGLNLNILDGELLTTVGTDFLEQAYELLHGVVLQLALTQVGLLDEELDVGLLLLLRDALVGIRSNGCLSRCDGALIEF